MSDGLVFEANDHVWEVRSQVAWCQLTIPTSARYLGKANAFVFLPLLSLQCISPNVMLLMNMAFGEGGGDAYRREVSDSI